MSMVEKVKSIKPGWRIEVSAPEGLRWTGVVVQHFGPALYFVGDGTDRLVPVSYEDIENERVTVTVTDTSNEIDIEEIDGPWQGLSTFDVLGERIMSLTHDTPVQSGPVNTTVTHPRGGYDDPEKDPYAITPGMFPSDQIAILAEFIMHEVPGEPSQSQGAVETAIRLLRDAYTGEQT